MHNCWPLLPPSSSALTKHQLLAANIAKQVNDNEPKNIFKIGDGCGGCRRNRSPNRECICPCSQLGKYDFGSGPAITDRLNQGAFPAIPTGSRISGGRGSDGDDAIRGDCVKFGMDRNTNEVRYREVHVEPRFDNPYFPSAYKELNGLLAAELNGSPPIEYMDTFNYGFWGEGHTWP